MLNAPLFKVSESHIKAIGEAAERIHIQWAQSGFFNAKT